MAAGLALYGPMRWAHCYRWLLIVWALVLAFSSDDAEAQFSLQKTTEFSREVNQYRWNSTIAWSAEIDRWQLELTNRFLSDAYIQYDDRLRFRDENRLQFRAFRPLGNRYGTSIRGDLDWFGSGRASSQALLAGVQIRSIPVLTIEPAVGVASDRRPGIVQTEGVVPLRIDTGPAGSIAIDLAPQELQSYRISFNSSAAWQRIAPRRAGDLTVAGTAARSFGAASLESSARFVSRRRDAYQAASFLNRGQARDPESIESTTSDTLDANLLVWIPITRSLRVIAQTNIRSNQRRIRTPKSPEESVTFETNFARQAFAGQVGFNYERDRIEAQLRAEYGAVNERRVLSNREELPVSEAVQKTTLLHQADYDEGVLSLSGNVRADILSTLSVLFTGSSRIVRHDTPIVNLDDRDEIYHTSMLGLRYRRSRYLSTEVRLFASYHHTVFLNAERSAENNIQRTLRLRPAINWTPSPGTRVRLASEVRATYTTDDFVLPGRRSTDQSAREMRLESEVEKNLFANTDLRLSASFADLRLGRLQWKTFTEVPFDTLRTYSAWLRVQSGRRLRGEVGWRTFLRSDYDRAVSVRYQFFNEQGAIAHGSITRPGRRWIIQTGPSSALYWIRPRSSLRLEAWANWQQLRYWLYGQLPPASEDIIRRAARRGTRRLLPLISLSMTWQL